MVWWKHLPQCWYESLFKVTNRVPSSLQLLSCKDIQFLSFFVFFFWSSFCLFAIPWATTAAYGGSQARDRIWAVATGLHHSTQFTAGSLTHWVRPGIKPKTSWFLVEFIFTGPQWELPPFFLSVCLYSNNLKTSDKERSGMNSKR